MFPQELITLVDEDSYHRYQPVKGLENTTTHRTEMYDKIITDVTNSIDVRGMRILEPGALYGYFSFELTRRGAEVTIVERDSKRARICSLLSESYGLPVTVINEDILKYKNRDFDLLWFMNVFHHIIGSSDYIGRSIMHRLTSDIPQMIFSMGVRRGPNTGGMTHNQVGGLILPLTAYQYCKKISEWGNRNIYWYR